MNVPDKVLWHDAHGLKILFVLVTETPSGADGTKITLANPSWSFSCQHWGAEDYSGHVFSFSVTFKYPPSVFKLCWQDMCCYLISSSEANRRTALAYRVSSSWRMTLSKSEGLWSWGIFKDCAIQIPPEQTKQRAKLTQSSASWTSPGLRSIIYPFYRQWL